MSSVPFISHRLFVAAAVPARPVPRSTFGEETLAQRDEPSAEDEPMPLRGANELCAITLEPGKVSFQGGDSS
jgi:hypothetical protein